jgi:uncharacterized protein YbaP (TraB family)
MDFDRPDLARSKSTSSISRRRSRENSSFPTSDLDALDRPDIVRSKSTSSLSNRASSLLNIPMYPQESVESSLSTSQNQTVKSNKIEERGNGIEELSKVAPKEGANLWKCNKEESGETLYILGTMHGVKIYKLHKAKELVQFLSQNNFDKVYTEIAEEAKELSAAELKENLTNFSIPEPTEGNRVAKIRHGQKKQRAERSMDELGGLDEVYSMLASKGNGSLGLETEESRKNIRDGYAGTLNEVETRYENYEEVEQWITSGNEQKLMEHHSGYLKKGIDVQDIEARNDEWVANKKEGERGSNEIWIVGASHLGGLVSQLQSNGWNCSSIDFRRVS